MVFGKDRSIMQDVFGEEALNAVRSFTYLGRKVSEEEKASTVISK